jgi:hypothetical protein
MLEDHCAVAGEMPIEGYTVTNTDRRVLPSAAQAAASGSRCRIMAACERIVEAYTTAMPDQKVVGVQAYCEAEAESDVRLNDARFNFESMIYSIIYE